MTAPPERDYEQCRSESLSLAVAGVAHDFKNALQTIKMNLELAALATQSAGKAAIHISEAALALGDAETLARQMLAFTRGESTQRREPSARVMKFATARGALACSSTTVTTPIDVVMSASRAARARPASRPIAIRIKRRSARTAGSK
jgi:signal transduction histidine kinase